jgi:hypothetical protein
MFNKGCCVDLVIKTWQGKLNPRYLIKELNILEKDFDRKVLAKGKLKLISDDLRKLFYKYEVLARVWLDNNTYKFMNTRFIPYNTIETLLGGDGDNNGLIYIQNNFNAGVDHVLERFDEIRNEFIESVVKIHPEYKEGLEKIYPNKEEIKDKFKFEWTFYSIGESKYNCENLSKSINLFKNNAKQILRDKIYYALNKFQIVLKSINTVKSSSVNALRKAINNFGILNFCEDNELELMLDNILDQIKDTNNIMVGSSNNIEFRTKLSNDIDKIINNSLVEV